MVKVLSILFLLLSLALAGTNPEQKSGIEMSNIDNSVRPQDNFYLYANGGWLEKTEIPADKASYGSFHILFDENQKRLREIIETTAQGEHASGSDKQKVGDLSKSFMDTTLIEELGVKPLKKEFARINKINDRDGMLEVMTGLDKIGVQTPIGSYIGQDSKNTTRYLFHFTQSGLSLPDRDYYLKDEERFTNIREKFVAHMTRMFEMAEIEDAAKKAEQILKMETEIAQHHWTRVENRDRNKAYNKYAVGQLNELMPSFSLAAFVKGLGVENAEEVIVRQPDYFQNLDKIFTTYSVDDWKTYYNWKLLDNYAGSLSKNFVEADFDFYSRTLRGIQQNRPRWKRGVGAVNNVLGEVVGKVYVDKYFKPAAKARMVELVDNLRITFAERIENLDWMSAETKEKALVKLNKFNAKIGYPDKWKDYSKLEIKNNELLKNRMRASLVEHHRQINKLGKPIDRDEWFMTPQTVNAYYSPSMNEVVFPAAILQPPFFNMEAEDAVNYGGIGAVIGHEMSHGFDDQGSKSDGDGNLVDWWTEKDAEEFTKRGNVLVEQFNKYEPLDSVFVNGELTLGENIGDLGGMAISYNAYKNSLNGAEAPVIDGLTGEQRFFFGWAQVWRGKIRDKALEQQVLTDPHSPGQYRVLGILSNLPEFYEAFDVKEGDPMYRNADQRAQIW